MPLESVLGRRPTSHRNICTKVLLAEGRETPFTEHCRNYENCYRVCVRCELLDDVDSRFHGEHDHRPVMNVYVYSVIVQTLQTDIQNLKDQVQELHRDLTKHHTTINTDTMGEILDRSLHIDSQIASQYSTVETMRVMFEEVCQVLPWCVDLHYIPASAGHYQLPHLTSASKPSVILTSRVVTRRCKLKPLQMPHRSTASTSHDLILNGFCLFFADLGGHFSEGHKWAGDLWRFGSNTDRKIKKYIWKWWFCCVLHLKHHCCLNAAQLLDLMQLKQENFYLTTIARQISPYIMSIAKVKERLEPRCVETWN